MMNKDELKGLFATYEVALKLKEVGFNEGCLGKFCRYNPKDDIDLYPESQNFFKGYFNLCYNEYLDKDVVAAPLWQQAILFLNKFSNLAVSESAEISSFYLFYKVDMLEAEILKSIENLKK